MLSLSQMKGAACSKEGLLRTGDRESLKVVIAASSGSLSLQSQLGCQWEQGIHREMLHIRCKRGRKQLINRGLTEFR